MSNGLIEVPCKKCKRTGLIKNERCGDCFGRGYTTREVSRRDIEERTKNLPDLGETNNGSIRERK